MLPLIQSAAGRLRDTSSPARPGAASSAPGHLGGDEMPAKSKANRDGDRYAH
jgi:hypothetical protein